MKRLGPRSTAFVSPRVVSNCRKARAVDAAGQLDLDFAASVTQKLSRNELRIFDATPPVSADQGVSAGDIARDAGMRISLVIHLLVALEQQGLVVRSGGLWQRTAVSES